LDTYRNAHTGHYAKSTVGWYSLNATSEQDKPMISRIIEGTFTAVLVYLVLSQASQFSTVMSAIARTYTSGVKTLQAR
jgi:hypothetical protein